VIIVLTNNQVSTGHLCFRSVTDEKDQPLPGVTIRVRGQDGVGAITNTKFLCDPGSGHNAVLEITYIGYANRKYRWKQNLLQYKTQGRIWCVKRSNSKYRYQSLLKERARVLLPGYQMFYPTAGI